MVQDQPPDAPTLAVQGAPLTLSTGVVIRPMESADADQVLAVYQAGLDTGQASFETVAPSWEAFDAAKLPVHRFTAAGDDGRVRPDHHGQGVGAALLQALIRSADAAGIWTIQSSIFPENTASLRLHQQAGFRAVGTRERIARHHGQWRDTVLIERRSNTAGTS